MKLGVREIEVLRYISRMGGEISARTLADLLLGEDRRLRSLFRKGLVQGDEVPARNVKLTEAARAVLAANT